jgi:hypothetical protein
MRADRPSTVAAYRGAVPSPRLTSSPLQIEELAPGQGLAVSTAPAVRVEPGPDGVLALDGVLELRHQGAKLEQEREGVGALEVSLSSHASSRQEDELCRPESLVSSGPFHSIGCPVSDEEAVAREGTEEAANGCAEALLLLDLVVVVEGGGLSNAALLEAVAEWLEADRTLPVLCVVDALPLLAGDARPDFGLAFLRAGRAAEQRTGRAPALVADGTALRGLPSTPMLAESSRLASSQGAAVPHGYQFSHPHGGAVNPGVDRMPQTFVRGVHLGRHFAEFSQVLSMPCMLTTACQLDCGQRRRILTCKGFPGRETSRHGRRRWTARGASCSRAAVGSRLVSGVERTCFVRSTKTLHPMRTSSPI